MFRILAFVLMASSALSAQAELSGPIYKTDLCVDDNLKALSKCSLEEFCYELEIDLEEMINAGELGEKEVIIGIELNEYADITSTAWFAGTGSKTTNHKIRKLILNKGDWQPSQDLRGNTFPSALRLTIKPDNKGHTLEIIGPMEFLDQAIYTGAMLERNEEEPIFKVVEQMPAFVGCENIMDKGDRKQCADRKMLDYIYEETTYPSLAKHNRVEGTAVISFVVEKDGYISGAWIARDPGDGTGEEALRVINSMNDGPPLWQCGLQNGRPVRVQFNLPIRFKLPEK